MKRQWVRKPGEIWRDVRCLEEHLRVVSSVVCAIGGARGGAPIPSRVAEDDRDEVEDDLTRGSLFGGSSVSSETDDDGPGDNGGKGNICNDGEPCDGDGEEITNYLDALERYCKLVMEDVQSLVDELDEKERVKFCGGMLCLCPKPKKKKKKKKKKGK